MTQTQKKHIKDLTVITTHINADFDAMASMLAAQKLYPGYVAVDLEGYRRGAMNEAVVRQDAPESTTHKKIKSA